MSTITVNTTYKNLYYLQQPEIEVIATIKNNDQLNLFCRSLYDSSIKFRETIFALFFVGFDCIGLIKAGSGDANCSIQDSKYIIRVALLLGCEYVVVCHNHPNGMLIESKDDKRSRKHLKAMLNTIGIATGNDIILSGLNTEYIIVK